MNLVIDIGNSLTKLGIFNNSILVDSLLTNHLKLENLSKLFKQYSVHHCIISSVAENPDKEIIAFLSKLETLIHLNSNSKLPFTNHYKTPETIGKDRLAAVAGAMELYPNKNVLVIDAGTAITYDFLDSKGNFLGGNISPGINMRFKALNQFTKRLPLSALTDTHISLGLNTLEAISGGVQNGVTLEMDGFINDITTKYPTTTTIITGGDSDFFAKNLKNPIFVHQNLVLIGLNRILNYNAL